MSYVRSDYYYTNTHEWVCVQDDGTWKVGITDQAQHALGDVVFIELPEVGCDYAMGSDCAVVESDGSAIDVACPGNGRIIAVNEQLTDDPQWLNKDPYDKGWMFQLDPEHEQEIQELLTADDYSQLIDDE